MENLTWQRLLTKWQWKLSILKRKHNITMNCKQSGRKQLQICTKLGYDNDLYETGEVDTTGKTCPVSTVEKTQSFSLKTMTRGSNNLISGTSKGNFWIRGAKQNTEYDLVRWLLFLNSYLWSSDIQHNK